MNYIELTCICNDVARKETREILIAFLSDFGYESFFETESGVNAYIREDLFDDNCIRKIAENTGAKVSCIYSWQKIEDQNWNKAWEKNYEPVIISNTCLIKAPFHKNLPAYLYEITLEPKMSFGTGHHATTFLMIRQMLTLDFKDKRVLDMGCGTGILAILASKMGATSVDAIDIDDWAYKNAQENIEMNLATPNVTLILGDSGSIPDKKQYDVILANINRNILLNDMQTYARHMVRGGGLLLASGIYLNDLPVITKEALKNGLNYCMHSEKKDWVAGLFERSIV